MGWIKGRAFNEDGDLETYHFCWAEGMGSLQAKSQYWKTFHKIPPHWLLVRRLDVQISLLRKAVETGEPLKEQRPWWGDRDSQVLATLQRLVAERKAKNADESKPENN